MSLVKHPEDWEEIFVKLGVKRATASSWGKVFADTIDDKTFSAGEKDLREFIPQILHESAMLEKMSENLDYSKERIIELGNLSPVGSRWRSLIPRAKDLEHNPRAMANALYGGRYGNAPEPSDEGWNYRGRTPLGITFKDNYVFVGNMMGQDLVTLPGLLEQPHYALEACIHWWEDRIPDEMLSDELRLRKKVNGGTFGLKETIALGAKFDAIGLA